MLKLKRRINESIQIGNNVSVRVLGVNGHQVRIGIEAPKEIPVHREEIYERLARERMTGSDSEDMLLEDMLRKGIDDAMSAATKSGELTQSQQLEIVEKATNDFVQRVKKAVEQITPDSIGNAGNSG